ncbi:Hpt domain-containing protein [Bdellovibrio sp. HCB2-146]|uniref:Hpt domain-containing protein n=1 Tax=Bdellovibrio sp. HCB2-146 TaxID=3394362 RepID=UPI0039BCE5AF
MANNKVEVDADLQDLIPQFLENRKKDLEVLQGLVEKNDLDALAQLAHKIKGAAAGYGFVKLSDYASQMEAASKRKDPAPLPRLMQDMKAHFDNIEVLFVSM